MSTKNEKLINEKVVPIVKTSNKKKRKRNRTGQPIHKNASSGRGFPHPARTLEEIAEIIELTTKSVTAAIENQEFVLEILLLREEFASQKNKRHSRNKTLIETVLENTRMTLQKIDGIKGDLNNCPEKIQEITLKEKSCTF